MKRFVAAVAVALLFTLGATAARSDDTAQTTKPKATMHKKAAKKHAAGCPAGCCEQGKPCPMAAQGGSMPADCPCMKGKQAPQGDATK